MSVEWLSLRIGMMNSLAMLTASLFAVFARNMEGASGSIGICIIYTDILSTDLNFLNPILSNSSTATTFDELVKALIKDIFPKY